MLPVFSGVRVAHLLLLLCMILVTLCSLLCMSVFHVLSVPGLHSFDYRYNIGSIDYSFRFLTNIRKKYVTFFFVEGNKGAVVLDSLSDFNVLCH